MRQRVRKKKERILPWLEEACDRKKWNFLSKNVSQAKQKYYRT